MKGSGSMANLRRLRPGYWVNPSDPSVFEKSARFGQDINIFTQIREWISGGRVIRAKKKLFALLRFKESLYVHELLAPLLTYEETKMMLDKYKSNKHLNGLYKESLNRFPPNMRSSGFRWGLLTLALLALLLLLLLGSMFFTWLFLNRHTTIIRHQTTDQIDYVSSLGNVTNLTSIPVNNNTPSVVEKAVEQGHMKIGQMYTLSEGNKVVGRASRTKPSTYHIWLQQGKPKAAPVSSVTPLQLNELRTAYSYYLSSHNGSSPNSLKSLSSLVPSGVKLSGITYHPSISSPEKALSTGSSVPYNPITVQANINSHHMLVKLGNKVLLSTPIGVGSASEPTPIGEFTVTNRIVNHGAPIYGQYIFPLNHSQYAIHGTDNPTRVGKNLSIGCIELPKSADKKLYSILPVGSKVLITNGTPVTSYR